MDGNAARHIDAYIEYNNIVGMDDGGQMMSEAEFEAYKEKVREARKNRLYVHWRNANGQDCKTIGPASQCFCGHRYKNHAFDNVDSRQVHCKAMGKNGKRCKCKQFCYIPVFGSQDLKCLCKHSCHEHDPNGIQICTRPGCKCSGFQSKHHCNCGMTYMEHETVFESREEREAQGRPVDPKWMQEQSMAGGLGGLGADYQALADGQDLADMRNPQAIVGNLNEGNMVMAPGMRQAIKAQGMDPKYNAQGGPPPLRVTGGGMGGGGPQQIQYGGGS